MDPTSAKMIGAGLAAIALAGAGVGIGNIFAALVSSIARNPAARDQVFGIGMLGFALDRGGGAVRLADRLPRPLRGLGRDGAARPCRNSILAGFVPQLFWLAVTFLVLYLLMKRSPCRRSARRSRRAASGSTAISAAPAELKAEAETVLAAYEKALSAARAEAQATLRETAERLAAAAAERQRQLAAALAAQIAEAERRIAAGKDEALARDPRHRRRCRPRGRREIDRLAPPMAREWRRRSTARLPGGPR